MTRLRHMSAALGVLAVLVAVVGIWLLLHNPTVRSTSLGHYMCSAPYDTVLLDADNVPGGEPPADADEVEARCIDVGQARFVQGLVVVAAAGGLAVAAVAVRRRTTQQEDVAHAG